MMPSPGIEPGTHWWKASVLTTAPTLLLQQKTGENDLETNSEIWSTKLNIVGCVHYKPMKVF